jgi:hypothetical protein
MYVIGGTIALDGTVIRSNSANEGGGMAINGGGVYTIERSWFQLNSATADGGGIALRDVTSNPGAIRSVRFQDNDAGGTGGAIALLGTYGAGAIVNDTFAGNESVGRGGAVVINLTDGTALIVRNNVLHSNDGPAAMWESAGAGATVDYNTAYLTNSGVHFDGDIASGGPYDTNVVRNPVLASFSDDGNPDNDDLSLGSGSPEIDAGDPDPAYNDQDGTVNDRGYTGGPAAP